MAMSSENGIKITGTLLRLVAMIVGVAAAYFLTIQSLRVELAAKAESSVVEKLDKKLDNIEVILNERMVSKEQFYQFSNNIETRLSRIEYRLGGTTGDKVGKSQSKP